MATPDPPDVVQLLGEMTMSRAGRNHSVPEGSKHLLAFVSLRSSPIDSRSAACTLWPSCSAERATGNLRSALWRLRRAGVDVLYHDRFLLGLRRDVAVDSHQLRAWADRVLLGDPTEADLDLRLHGPDSWDLLPGWSDSWVLLERESLRQRVLHALEALSRTLSHDGRHADAVQAALSAVLADPLRESAQRALIESHLAEDNWVEASRAFARYRDVLQGELGLSPSPELVAMLRGELRGRRVSRAGSAASAPRRSSPRR